ncbi:hypothetical protein EDB83DRAFT_839563 [Lactarius deliciosus]|nr:hypothetical protein EDB83DRAFT_839563 [Lactarius deliciosus]
MLVFLLFGRLLWVHISLVRSPHSLRLDFFRCGSPHTAAIPPLPLLIPARSHSTLNPYTSRDPTIYTYILQQLINPPKSCDLFLPSEQA